MKIPSCRSRFCFYFLAVGTSALALYLQSELGGALEERVAYLLLYPTVFFISWFGGLGAGMVSIACCSLGAWYFFVPPYYSLAGKDFSEVIRLVVFAGMGILIDVFNSRLKKAEAFAREAMASLEDEKKDRECFLASLAHDLRNPLAGARASAELVLRYPNRTDLRETQLRRVISALGRADRMIEDLLDVQRVRAGGTLPLRIQQVVLFNVIQEIVAELSLRHGPRFVVNCRESVRQIMGYWDPDQIKRIIENLAGNAVKYGSKEDPVTVTLRRNLIGGVEISVHNFGSFLTQEERERLFELYHRTSSARLSGKKGWGLGLTVVRGIAEAHGGKVTVESHPDEGTTFVVELPIDVRASQSWDEVGLSFQSGDRPLLKKAI